MNRYDILRIKEQALTRKRNRMMLELESITPARGSRDILRKAEITKVIKAINYRLNDIQKAMSDIRRDSGHMKSKERAQLFVEVAREILPDKVFINIMQIVEGRSHETRY